MTFMHDAWLRAKVQEALADKQPTVPHQQVMDEAQAIIDKKRLSSLWMLGTAGIRHQNT